MEATSTLLLRCQQPGLLSQDQHAPHREVHEHDPNDVSGLNCVALCTVQNKQSHAYDFSVKLEPGRATVSVPLVHRHGPCAPSSHTTDQPSFTERLGRSRARAKHILSRASKAGMAGSRDVASSVTIPTHLGGSVDSLEYVVTVGLGTPAVPQVLLMDTGSDLSWVQCAPCNSTACYPQKGPLFDPRKSSTYAPVPCHTEACKNLTGDQYGNGCTSGGAQCGYAITYGDGSQTTGVYSDETLALAPGVTVRGFHFGCGYDQTGANDKYDGLVGLGGAPESLVVQTSSVYGGAFSYCLPALNSEAGFLALGAPSAAANTSGFVFTPMSRIPEVPTFYVVELTGIAVGGKQIHVPPSAFSGGMILDSGTVVTQLQHTAYTALQAAFRKAMAAYPLLPNGDLDTCYNFTGYSNVTVPRVALTFSGGATVDLDVPDGILLQDCLAVQDSGPDDQPGIIGNVNQRTLEVLYDAGRGRQNHYTVSLPLVHRHGPCAPSLSIGKPPFAADTLHGSRAHVAVAPLSTGSHGEGTVSIPANLGSSLNSLEYVVTVSFGTPAVPQVVLIDTGSDLSWLQCKPCSAGDCSPQKDPLFDPGHSSTYSLVPCVSDVCKQLTADEYGGGCANVDNQCGFAISYGDGTSTVGVYGKDKLTLAPGVAVDNFYFGCGHVQRAVAGLYDGLLGLGRLSESLGAQYGGGGAFSYCLPAVNSRPGFSFRRRASAALPTRPSPTGFGSQFNRFLALGAGKKNTSGFLFTPMGRVPGQPTFFMVTLTTITVGGKKLDLRPSSFFDGSMIVDSGSVITGLQFTAYKALRSAFRTAMAAYPLVPNGPLDTCYNFTGHKDVLVPTIALTFSGGATINLDVPNGILVDGCLAFADAGPEGGPGILGNVNQRTFEVLFDNRGSKVGFRANAC
ncbi:hypothetical protein U9M48_028737 [Paspalum notatum var. saurae]|uniref:Peptidase A1 domain-containing protein n=1 Tax=Paspalum notatum var. saurae TaxID=547442 RepID=A0AAQ3U1S8_PASNO